MKNILTALALLTATLTAAATEQPATSVTRFTQTSRLVVTLKPRAQAMAATEHARLASTFATVASAGQPLKLVHQSADGRVVYDLGRSMPMKQAQDLARRLAQDASVQSVEPDVWVKPKLVPQDPYYFAQWGLNTPSDANNAGGINISPIWERTTGSGLVMAVLDTGMVAHPEFASRIIAGYDFVSDPTTGGDGDGRDSDPTDPGDYCTESGTLEASSWHGTMVGGIMAAAADAQGMVGVAPSARLLNVRVLGRCGGWMSDVADGIRWTAGLAVSGAGTHAYGPLVMNLSLATDPTVACPAFLQDAIDAATAAGASIVAAAGNEGFNGVGAPANCKNVVSVAAHTGSGDLAGYSNYAPGVTISGPGGGSCKKATSGCYTFPAIAPGVSGATTLQSFGSPVYMAGTSAAAPFAAVTLGLLRHLEPSLTPAQATALLTNSARPFGVGTFCKDNAACGFGMLDAGAALARLDSYYAPSVTVSANVMTTKPGDQVVLQAAATSRAGTNFTYSWAQTAGPTVKASASNATLSYTAPSVSGTVVFEVVATDASGRTAKSNVSVSTTVNSAPVMAPVTNQTSVPGVAWTLTPSVTDVDGNFDRLVLLAGPQGLVANGSSLNWSTPVAGTYSVTVAAIDAANAESAPVSFTLTIQATANNGSGSGSSGGSGGGAWGLLGGLLLLGAAVLKRLAQR